MSRLGRVREVSKAPTQKVVHDDLTRQIQNARHDLTASRTRPIGKMLSIFLGPDDNAAYAQKADVRDRIASLSKVQGLQLQWTQDVAPHLSWTFDQKSLVFPFGCVKPPAIMDPRVPGTTRKMVAQNIADYASGYIEGVDGSSFVVMQPVLYIGVWIMDGLYNLIAHPDPISGKYPALLMAPRMDRNDALIVFGRFELGSARPSGGNDLPWNGRAA